MKINKYIVLTGIVVIIALILLITVPKDLFQGSNEASRNKQGIVEKQTKKQEPKIKLRKDNQYEVFKYGLSGNSQPLLAHKFYNNNPTRKILCVFEIHGFEDAFYRDGQALIDTADQMIQYFKENGNTLGAYELIIVPSANPDGVTQGWTCNGPGRCQISQGIDINMDTDYNFRVRGNPRNKTGDKPFTSPEAAALRDLVLSEKPDIVIDFHGWINCTAGDSKIANIFCSNLGVIYSEKDKAIFDGFFIGWAAKYSKAVLVEYPNPFTGKGSFDEKSDKKYNHISAGFSDFGYAQKTVKAIEEIVVKDM